MAPNAAEGAPGSGDGGGRSSSSSSSSGGSSGSTADPVAAAAAAAVAAAGVLHRRASSSSTSSSRGSGGGGVPAAPVLKNAAAGGPAGEGPAAAAAGVAAAGGKAVQCRSCVGLAVMTSTMRREGRPAACYGVRRGLPLAPELPPVRDEYIEEVLNSKATWTYACLGASETLVEEDDGGGSSGSNGGGKGAASAGMIVKGGLAPLPSCRGLLVFVDGEAAEEEENDPMRRRTRGRRGEVEGAAGDGGVAPERPTHIVGGIVNRRPTQQSQGQGEKEGGKPKPPRLPVSFPGGGQDGGATPLGDAARRVGEFWANASEDFGSKYWRCVASGVCFGCWLLNSNCIFFFGWGRGLCLVGFEQADHSDDLNPHHPSTHPPTHPPRMIQLITGRRRSW